MLLSKVMLYFFSALIILSVLLPLIKKDHWTFRVFDYPRLQKMTLIAILLGVWLIFFRDTELWIDWMIMGLLFCQAAFLFYVIIPYTPLSKPMIKRVKDSGQPKLTVLVANVYQMNQHYDKLLKLVERRNPDVVFLLETDQKWQNGVQKIKDNYPHSIEVPKDNTYGLLFYSRLPLSESQVNYLIDEEVPSIIADVNFEGQTIRIYGLHPTPPVPQENEHSTDRDAEILLIGKEAKKHEGPCLVIGDLNDVAWSYSTKLFLKSSELLDPRRGRGIYSTFNANYWLLRWPLDHFFLSSHFRLIDMRVENHIGSDHFPISISVCVRSEEESEKLTADSEEKELVEEKIQAGINDDPR